MVVFRLFEKLRYSKERSTKFESLYQEQKYLEEENGKMVAFQIAPRPSNSHGLTVTLTVWDAISRSHGFAFKSHGEPKTSKLPKNILHRLENMKE